MPICRERRCDNSVLNEDDLCLTHLIAFLDKMTNPLHGDDLSFIIANHGGCNVFEVVVYLGVPPDIIGLFLEYKRGLRGYRDPHRFLDQSLLLLILQFRDGLDQVNREFKSRNQELEPKKDVIITPVKSRHQVDISSGELFMHDAAGKLGISESTMIKWVKKGLIPYTKRATSQKGRTIKIFQLDDIITFAEKSLRNPDFLLYHERFQTFLTRNNQTS